jgi:hypothetical protein
MMTMASGGDVASFGGRDRGGCNGVVVSNGCDGGRARGGFLGGRRDRGNCCGAQVDTCCAPVQSCGCTGGSGKHGGGLFGGRRNGGCYGTVANNCCAPAYSGCCGSGMAVAAPCSYGTAGVVMPAAGEPAKEMPKPVETPKKKDN